MFTGMLDFLLTCVLMFSAGCASTYLYFTRNVKADPIEVHIETDEAYGRRVSQMLENQE